MYYRNQDLFGGELLGLGLVLMLIAAFFVVKASLFVIRTFVQYSNHKSLWISLAVCCFLSVVGILLGTQGDQSFLLLPFIGALVLLVTCLVVDMRNRDTFMRENVNLIDEVLHTPWWGSEDTPRVEQEQERAA